MAFYGVGCDVKVKELNLQFKMHIQSRGGLGLRNLKRTLNQFDYNGNRKLDATEFEQALASFGLFPKKVELQALMKFYDVDGDGNVSYEEFLSGLRDELSERRSAMVEKAFRIMDRDNSGEVTPSDVGHMYDVTCHKDFIEGSKTKEEIIGEFLDTFDGAKGNNDGRISKQEWFDYYTDLGVSLPSDDYFVQMMESTWGISENEDTEVYQQTIQEYVRVTKEQLITLLGDHNSDDDIIKLFQDFDLTQTGSITIDEFANMLAKLQIAVDRKYLRGIFRVINASHSGTIVDAEFLAFIKS